MASGMSCDVLCLFLLFRHGCSDTPEVSQTTSNVNFEVTQNMRWNGKWLPKNSEPSASRSVTMMLFSAVSSTK